jgi:hypothetical protein
MHLPAVLLQVQEEDDIWDPEQLLADVASAIHADREQGRGRTESRSSLVGKWHSACMHGSHGSQAG